jgi:hypothetical protein
VRRVPPRAWPGGTATGVTSPGNTAEPSRELSDGDVVAVGEAGLAVGRVAWTLVPGGLNEVRTDEHGTRPLPAPASDGADPDRHDTGPGEPLYALGSPGVSSASS